MIEIPRAVAARAATAYVIETSTGCWISTYSRTSAGYAQIGWQVGNERYGITAHRAAWVHESGEQIPDGMTVDHTCKRRSCVRPAHLRVLDNFENARRTYGWDWPLGECAHGHPNSNLVLLPNGHRCCAICRASGYRMSVQRIAISPGAVIAMRRDYSAGATFLEIVKAYGQPQAHVVWALFRAPVTAA